MKNAIARWLQNDIIFTIWASVAAFSTYTCMYAFRKPFTAGTFSDMIVWGMDFKILLVVSQVLGYMFSKFLGIKIIAEMSPHNRPLSILGLIGLAWLALGLFAVVPLSLKPLCLFLNGIPLGLIWGIVFSYLEGRQTTEILGAALAATFIIASGMVKSIGKYLMGSFGISEFNMPFFVGFLFFLPLLLSVWLLSQIPPPSVSDTFLRSERQPMSSEQRKALFHKYAFGIVCLLLFHFVLTAFRDFRDNFIVELWQSLGYTDAAILTSAEMPIAISVLILVSLMFLVKNNAAAFWLIHALILTGGILLILTTYLFENNHFSPLMWMMMTGFSLYLCYILFQVLIFERMMATFREIGNVGFLMYVADATGYLGSIIVMFYKNFNQAQLSWVAFFTKASYVVGIACLVLLSLSWFYFSKRYETAFRHSVKLLRR
jgi:hypothetical protein